MVRHEFSERAGFYFKLNSEVIPPDMSEWSVKIISINRDSRSYDTEVIQQFLKDIDHILTVTSF